MTGVIGIESSAIPQIFLAAPQTVTKPLLLFLVVAIPVVPAIVPAIIPAIVPAIIAANPAIIALGPPVVAAISLISPILCLHR